MKASYKFVAAFAAMLLLTVAACQQTVPFKKFANDDEVPRITLADAKKAFDEGNAVFVDSRAEPSFQVEHIAGAINIAYSGQAPNFDSLPKGKKIIVYCS
ncbi:MAG TPA: rhodanese-like domain-containing protein [Pyrinomonadaceae bacterium]|nr:rhodanese-like domain-containing protein [Chloracidobacterium sp.]MBP9936858.1 rhodanese-like domain-containing protein [Pyrinomonadaceae bacterium]MBK9437817.1 rhodanese-like domain-containing protein [Chloracidobacterium sp.]MBL0242343.1 rhodanese-like domain-containing protein [Chloracidobacterium sp.]HQX56056.1 rhodanese-like domain-containing protein [Pyrinomonadaceae bacterium]